MLFFYYFNKWITLEWDYYYNFFVIVFEMEPEITYSTLFNLSLDMKQAISFFFFVGEIFLTNFSVSVLSYI